MQKPIGVIELGIKGVRYIIATTENGHVEYIASQGTLVNFDSGFDNIFAAASGKDISKACETINSYLEKMIESGCRKVLFAYKSSLRHLMNFPQVIESIGNTDNYFFLSSMGGIETCLLDKEEEGRLLCETAYRTTLNGKCEPGDRIVVFDYGTGDTTFSTAFCTEEGLRHDKSVQNTNLSGKRLEQDVGSLQVREYSDIDDLEERINKEIQGMDLPTEGNKVFLFGTNNSIGNVLWQKEGMSGRYHPVKVNGLELEAEGIVRPVYLALAYRVQQGHSRKTIQNDLGLRNPSNVISVLAIGFALAKVTRAQNLGFCAYGLRHGLAHKELGK